MKFTNQYSDSELIELLKQDDHAAFECIYHKYSSRLYFSAYNILRSQQICEDLVQELFVSLWFRRNNIEINSLKSYLYKSIRNRVHMVIRSGKVQLDLSVIEELAHKHSADQATIENEINSIFNREVEALPEKCRQIFSMSRREQLSNKEIASQLNISPKTVENQITIALRRLRVTLGDFLLIIILFFFR